MKSQVTEVGEDFIGLKDGTRYGYSYLVGADGYSSLVRKYLKLPCRRQLLGFQYSLPAPAVDPTLEIILNARFFDAWYAWVFPHKDSLAVGFCCDPRKVNPKKMKAGFQKWLAERNIDPGDVPLASCPIACDYKGLRFGNIFLAGEAAGLASGLTGEGIYQSLVSGQEAGRMILDPDYDPAPLRELIRYNQRFNSVLRTLSVLGPFKGFIHELILFLLTRRHTRERINAVFS